jgi:hypothetical protein
MALQVEVVQGSALSRQIQLYDLEGTPPVVFIATDILNAYVWQGQNQATLFSPTVTWSSAPAGLVNLQLTNAMTLGLDYAANYKLQITVTRGELTYTVADGILSVLASPQAATDLILTYCQYSDLLLYAPWIQTVQNVDTDQEGFYVQRLNARNWLDEVILNNYRGSYIGQFDGLSEMALQFGYGVGLRRSIGPATAMITYLENNDLLLARPNGQPTNIVRICAYKAIADIGLAQIGLNNQLASLGAFFADKCDAEAVKTIAEVDTNGDGIGELFIPLGTTNTLNT